MMQTLDVLRGRYAQSPLWLRHIISPMLGLLPSKLIWGTSYRRYRDNIVRSESDSDFVAAYRLQQLNELITLCASRSAYYRPIIEKTFSSGLDLGSVDLKGFSELPILNKSTMRETPELLLVKEISQVDTVSTSGSSGVPVKFYLDRDRGAKEWAFYHHIWARIGYRVGHKRAVLRGVRIPSVDTRPWAYDASLRELLLSPFHLVPDTMDQYLRLIGRYGIHFIHGYPSAIAILAAHAIRRNWSPPHTLIGILPISESLLPYQRDLIHTAFREIPVLPFYGLSEKVAIAGEVPGMQDVYEFEPMYGHTELVDEVGQPITELGRIGRIIATGFISRAMPLLRYDTGDTAELVRLPHHDNCYRLRVRAIRSRWSQKFLLGSNGALISIAAINIHSAAYACISEFQFFQDVPGEVLVRVVPLEGYNEIDIQPFLDEIQAKVGATVRFRLHLCKDIVTNIRGKRPLIDQRIDLNPYLQHT